MLTFEQSQALLTAFNDMKELLTIQQDQLSGLNLRLAMVEASMLEATKYDGWKELAITEKTKGTPVNDIVALVPVSRSAVSAFLNKPEVKRNIAMLQSYAQATAEPVTTE